MNAAMQSDWTVGGDSLVFQRCASCANTWYFYRSFCPGCGHVDPTSILSKGHGIVHATTLVHRAPNEAFRALVPYAIALVEMAEGFRVMGHAQAPVQIGSAVRCEIRLLAGSRLPMFVGMGELA